mmetsp:Transcript_78466/g.227773  ORF Transcript_78466/g.227773 Transcript_78466/m.227773 type:complete len:155 (-) Transcript_78466:96-560(-)
MGNTECCAAKTVCKDDIPFPTMACLSDEAFTDAICFSPSCQDRVDDWAPMQLVSGSDQALQADKIDPWMRLADDGEVVQGNPNGLWSSLSGVARMEPNTTSAPPTYLADTPDSCHAVVWNDRRDGHVLKESAEAEHVDTAAAAERLLQQFKKLR